MIEFAHEKCGYPWHGLYLADTGKIVTPSDIEISPPGAVPVSDVYGFAGDCFAVQIPGMPVVSTETEEAEAGMTWLNYGLISGYDRVCFGRELGVNSWIAVADGQPWLISCAFSVSVGVLNITATIKRFGVFRNAPADQVLTVAHEIFYLNHGSMQAMVEDIKPGGMSALVGICKWVTGGRKVGGIVALDFVFAAGVWSMDLQTVIDFDGVYESEEFSSTNTDTGTEKYSAYNGVESWVIGARYGAAGSVEVAKIAASIDTEAWWTETPRGGNASATGEIFVTIGGHVVESIPYASEIEWAADLYLTEPGTGVTYGLASGTNSMTAAGVSSVYSWTMTTPGGDVFRSIIGAPSAVLTDAGGACSIAMRSGPGSSLSACQVFPIKHSSVLYGAQTIHASVSVVRLSALSGRVGSTGDVTVSAGSPVPIYATEHPVTGAIERSSSVVCWV